MDCESDLDCDEEIATCNEMSHMCLCKNGASTYPACVKTVGTQCKDCNHADRSQYCDIDGECKCTWGGILGDCCKHECTNWMSCAKGGKCECSYGKSPNGVCRRCKEDCFKFGATCEFNKGQYSYVCVLGHN